MIDSGYQDNEQNLDLLVSTIDKINHSPDSRVTDILIVGYASPEGDYRMNLDFAEKRAIALRDYPFCRFSRQDLKIQNAVRLTGSHDFRYDCLIHVAAPSNFAKLQWSVVSIPGISGMFLLQCECQLRSASADKIHPHIL